MSAFPRRWPVVTAAAWVVFAGLAAVLAVHGWRPFGFERSAIDWSAGHRPPAARHAAIAVTSLGTGAPPYLVALAAGAVLARGARATRRGRRDVVVLLLTPVLWLLAGQLVREGLMHAFARPRPSAVHWATTATGFSFPSGHSFTSAVCACLLVLAIARRRPSWTRAACVLAVLCAVAVGLSRVYLGVHWPLDVLGAWLLAAGWLAVGVALLERVDPRGGDAAAPGEAAAAGEETPAHRGSAGDDGGGESGRREPGGRERGAGGARRPERGQGRPGGSERRAVPRPAVQW